VKSYESTLVKDFPLFRYCYKPLGSGYSKQKRRVSSEISGKGKVRVTIFVNLRITVLSF